MISILIVEDDTSKLRKIISSLMEVPDVSLANIFDCRDANRAKRLLQEHSYDLLIIDIAIPDRIDEPPTPDGGVRLLNELCKRATYCQPHHIVGLTAYDESLNIAQSSFGARSWTVVRYDPVEDSWAEQLQTRVRHILAAKKATRDAPTFDSALAILCALDDPELASIRRLPWGWTVYAAPNDPTVYYRGMIERSGQDHIVYAACAPRMGMPATAALAMKMILTFRPRYLAMTGIAAGFEGKVNLGDVVAADVAWDYGNGKHEVVSGVPRFAMAPHQIGLEPAMRAKISLITGLHGELAALKDQWPADSPPSSLAVKLGPVASGAAVIADAAKVSEVQEQHRKLLALDMETYGLFAAALEAPEPRPTVFVLKGISDYADAQKDDRFRQYAAFVSAGVLRLLMERSLA